MFDEVGEPKNSMLPKIGTGFLIGVVGIAGLFGLSQIDTSSSKADLTTTSGERDLKIRGNKKSRIYHLPGCPNYDDIAEHNRVYFRTHEEAKAAGYRMARNC